MKIRQGTGARLRGRHLAIAAAAFAISSTAQAVTFEWGDWSGSWDNTISYGISWRAESPDPALIGKGNGGTGEAILTDDGNLNFDKGDIFSNIIKGTSELKLDNGQFGGFARIKYWYDFELENSKAPHGHGPNKYEPKAKLNDNDFADYAKFSGIELLDLFVYGEFSLGDNPLDLRVGRQVVNWGESAFIQGINVLNPIDVSAVRRPGVEVKEALLPVGLIYGNLGLPAGWSIEAYYQFKWEATVIDGCGTYFSNADFAAQGCNNLLAPEQEWPPGSGSGFFLPDILLQGVHNAVKDPVTDEAKDSGQFGLAVRKYAEAIDTEFGFYYQRLHNRTPVINSVFATSAIGLGSILGGQPVPSSYQIAYPEDVDIFGLSFATNIGTVAWSGEISLKQDMPVSVNGTTQLTGQLGVLSTGGSVCAAPDPTLFIGQFGARACNAWNDYVSQGAFFNPTARSVEEGYDRFDVTQAQTTFSYLWEQGLGAQRVTFVGEAAWIGVSDLPSIAEMPYGRNPIFGAPATGIGGPSDEGFVTSNSWGYRLLAFAEYSNVFGTGVQLTPRIAFSHDVNGTSPTPTFIDGRKAVSLALGANYLTRYRASIAYTWFWDGVANTATDRDFASFTVSMDF
jgi:hypothetical protein